ncbi:MAG: SGNH/GDSL hydrolase family protein [Candidatus Sumerlaeota bacterium]|nr:SGNH/GDSL hydrolase family protein [Candidatus Sumerlaeota bacterium]
MPRVTTLVAGVCALLAILSSCVARAAEKAELKPGARVAVVGDSITEQRQYSKFIELYLTVCVPQYDIHCFQYGWSGEKAGGFARRMDNDLQGFKPTIVTLCYGMNDGEYRAFDDAIGKRYQDPMKEIVSKLKAAGTTVIVGGPGAVDTKYFKKTVSPIVYNENLAKLSEIAKKIAAENAMPHADVHAALIAAMEKAKAKLGEDCDVCGRDGVHPGANGHIVMAYAILKAMNLDGEIGTITADMKGQVTASEGHKVLSSSASKLEIESKRYPFCFYGDEKGNSTRSITPFVPFNEDLNRLTLVVKNGDGARAKVTWGADSKTFTREALEKGVNLAAEFPSNPFSESFSKVESAIAAKQDLETMMIKDLVTRFPAILSRTDNDAEVKASLDTLQKRLMARNEQLRAKAVEAFQPVKHTIQIEKSAE